MDRVNRKVENSDVSDEKRIEVVSEADPNKKKTSEEAPKIRRPVRYASIFTTPHARRRYGRWPLLPGESGEAYLKLLESLTSGDIGEFGHYIEKEMADALMQLRRWRSATIALIDAYSQNPQSVPPMIGSDPATKLLPSPDALLATVPVSPAETTAILAYCGLDPETSIALSLLQAQKLRSVISVRAEAAERTYQGLQYLTDVMSEARAQLATKRSNLGYVKARTKQSLYYPKKKPPMPTDYITDRPEFVTETPVLVDFGGFTELGRSILGPPPILKGESEIAYAGLYHALMSFLGYSQVFDSFLVNDAAAATWEMRRLREASETIFCLFFRIKARQMLAGTEGAIGKEEPGKIEDRDLRDALQKAGIATGHVSALTLGDLARVLSTLDDELDRLEYRRRQALKALIVSRAKSSKISYLKARQLEITRLHEWKTHKDRCEFYKKYEAP